MKELKNIKEPPPPTPPPAPPPEPPPAKSSEGSNWQPPDLSACLPKMPEIGDFRDIGKQYSKCSSDALIKTTGGLGLGIIFSILFFRGRLWPIALWTGFGAGAAFRNCNLEIDKSKKN